MPYYDPATAESEEQHYLNVAADIVADLAPPPDSETTEYQDKAARAERLLLNYLSSTSGASLTSVGGRSGSLSFTQMEAVRNIVASSMSAYYTGGSVASTGYVGIFPR